MREPLVKPLDRNLLVINGYNYGKVRSLPRASHESAVLEFSDADVSAVLLSLFATLSRNSSNDFLASLASRSTAAGKRHRNSPRKRMRRERLARKSLEEFL